MEGLGVDAQTLGIGGGGLLIVLTLLGKFQGFFTFERDESGLRKDLMQLAREARVREEAARKAAADLRADMLRLQVSLDAVRAQARLMIDLLNAVKAGQIEPSRLDVPDLALVHPDFGGA